MIRNLYITALMMSVFICFALMYSCSIAKAAGNDNREKKPAITASLPLEERECAKTIIIPPHGFYQLSCSMTAPDSMQLNAQGSTYTNNPITVVYTIINTGKFDIDNIQAEITLSSGLVTFEPLVKNVSPLLKPGQSANITWQVRALSAVSPSTETILIRAYTPDDIEIQCEKTIFVPALKISLLCKSILPDSIKFDVNTKTYQPNPFTATVTLTNKKSFQIDSVIGTIILPPELELINGEQSTKLIGTMYSGHERSLSWQIQVKNLLPNGKDVQIIFQYKSLTDSAAECIDYVYISSGGDAKLSCNLSCPDTIYYRSNGYQPDPFTIQVRAMNIGYQNAINAHAYLLQDPRFNIIWKADQSIGTIQVGNSDSVEFIVRVQPKLISGYDTIRVLLTADGIEPKICEQKIWVEGKSLPAFSLHCTAAIDSLRFDSKLHDYVPNPFTVSLQAQNIGNADAYNCQFVFIGPPRFTLASGTPVHPLGTILIGDKRTDQFQMRALLQTQSIVDTIVFQEQSQSSTGEIIINECRVPIFVPAAFGPQYTISCSAPDSLRAFSGGYVPNPFTISARVKNAGNGKGFAIQSTIALPGGFTLANGEQPTKNLPDLSGGDSTIVSWNVLAIDQPKASVAQICIAVKDQFGVDGSCCHQIFIPASTKQNLSLRCTTKDTLHASQTGYIENPFTVQTTIVNNASYSMSGIEATITADPSITLLDPATQKILTPLASLQSIVITWRVIAAAQQRTRELPFLINVTAPNEQPATCTVSTIATSTSAQILQLTCESSVKDTLHFLYDQGAFEQDPFLIKAHLTNPGMMNISNLKVDLIVPPGIALAQGEQPDKIIPMLNAGSTVDLSWKIIPMRVDKDFLREFKIRTESQIISGQMLESVECGVNIYIQGAPRIAIFSVPKNLIGQFGDHISVPMTIECPGSSDINDYVIRLQYDSKVIRFVDVIGMGQLNTQSWSGPDAKLITQDEIEISGHALNQNAMYKENTLFLSMLFDAVFGDGDKQLWIAQSPVSFQSAIVNNGSVHTDYDDGLVTVSGKCIKPLVASASYNLFQNNPNPFNPNTMIVFTLPEETIARLEIYDGMGQQKGILLNKVLPAGKYSVPFDGSVYPSGAYYYRLVTPKYTATKRMMLVK